MIEVVSLWKGCWIIVVIEYNCDVVNVMLYVFELDGLVGEEVYIGWFISFLKRFFNFWECCGYFKVLEFVF